MKNSKLFLIFILLVSISCLIWLYLDFLKAIFFAIIWVTASYPLYLWLHKRIARLKIKCSMSLASLVMTVVFVVLFLFPMLYIFVKSSIEAGTVIKNISFLLNKESFLIFEGNLNRILAKIPLLEDFNLKENLNLYKNWQSVLDTVTDITRYLLNNSLKQVNGFAQFAAIACLSIFFLYKDGYVWSQKILEIMPIDKKHIDHLANSFYNLTQTMLVSTVFVAVLQGFSLSMFALLYGLPVLFIFVVGAITSLVPVVGTSIFWLPTTIYLIVVGDYYYAAILVFIGIIFNAVLIDSIFRHVIIYQVSKNKKYQSKVYVYFTILSTFAGIFKFGILGLIFGPVISAMAISIFSLYYHINTENQTKK